MDNCNQTYNSCQVVTKCQADPLTTNDIGYVGGNDTCLDIKAPLTLTDVLRKLITFDKNRLFSVASKSLKVSLLPTVCDKTARIEIIPSTDANNIFVLGTDGYPFVPVTVATGSLNSVAIADTNSVDLSGTGNLITPITANVKLNSLPTNLIASTTTGLLTELEVIKDIRNNLKQHIVFERPPIKALTYQGTDDNGNPATVSLTKVYLCNGLTVYQDTYANNFSLNNPDVKLFWGDTTIYENTLDNEPSTANALWHDYAGLIPSSGEIELKTYNNTYLKSIKTKVKNTTITGFRAIKGGELLKNVEITGAFLSSSAVMDFKNMFNVESIIVLSTFNSPNSSYTLKNTQDLTSLKELTLGSFIEGSPNLTLSNPAFNNLQLYSASKGLKNLVITNKTSLSVYIDASSVDTLDLGGSNLTSLSLSNCGSAYIAFINRFILTLNTFTPTGSMFNFSSLKSFSVVRTNGVRNDGTVKGSSYNICPTKLLMYNKLNNNILDFVEITQDWVKDEIFISLNDSIIQKGYVSFTITNSFGLKYNADYYNPIWAPLNGQAAYVVSAQSGGVVTYIRNPSLNETGFGYNSIPQIVTIGPGTGLVTTTVMTLKNYSGANPVSTPGSGYIVGNIYPFTGIGVIMPVLLLVYAVSATGGILSSELTNGGEFTSLPTTITNINGAVYNTTGLFNYKYSIITNGGTGYTDTTIYKLETSTVNGTGSGTASTQAKAAIESLHEKGWVLLW